MGPTGKIVIAFLAGIALAVVGLHIAWQANNRGTIDLSDWIARYERAFEPGGARQTTASRDELAERVTQLEKRIASLENVLQAPQKSASNERPPKDVATAPVVTEVPPTTVSDAAMNGDYDIDILNWEWTLSRYSAKFVNATGLVRNVSEEQLENSYASVQWYDAEGNFLTSQDASLDISPLAPGETASFKISIPLDSRMYSARLRFRTRGGKIISSADSIRTETPLEIPPLTD